MRLGTPATLLLRRAQLTLILVVLVPTVLLTAVGIVLLALGAGRGSLVIVAGVLVLAFAATAITGYILGSIFLAKGATQAKMQNDFLSLVSHELRTPLTSIGLFLGSLRDERMTDEAEKQRCFELLEKEVKRMGDLVERLLALSRLEAGRYALDIQPIAVTDLIEDGRRQLQAAVLPADPAVTVECEDGLTVLADRTSLSQAIGNLLINAWKYGGDRDPEITVRARSDKEGVLIDVSDRGPGIPRTEQKMVFDKFERGSRAVDSGESGSGLGLAIVKAAIEAHEGSIEVHSRAGRGSTFRMKLKRPKAA